MRLVEKLNAAQQLTATLTLATINVMSYDDRCFVCGQTGHFGHHCHNVQCYSCDEFGYFAQHCPNKIPHSGTPCHQGRFHSWHQYTHTQGTDHTPPSVDTDKETFQLITIMLPFSIIDLIITPQKDFTITIVDRELDKNRRLRLEEYWITLLDTLAPKGLNGRW